jgi:predicted esterase
MKRSALALVVLASLATAFTAHADTTKRPITITISLDQKDQAQLERMRKEFETAITTELGKLSRPLPAPPVVPPTPTPTPAPAPQPSPDPLPDGLVPLPVPGFGAAVVSLPLPLRGPRPVMVVTHGNNDHPQSHCETWRRMVLDRGFILCPRGIQRPGTSAADPTFTHGKEMGSEIEAGLSALRARYGAFVDPGPMIYMGFSQGAGLGPGFVMKNPARFPRAVMIEGGSGGWNEQAFAKAGGQRVLFACGQAGCVNSAKPVSARFERAKVASSVAYARGAGHVYGGAVADAIKAEWAWLVEGDPRWAR